MLNPDIAYLLGMIAGKGEIKRGDTYTQIIISIPHKNLEIEGQNTQQSVRASLLDITQRLHPLIGADLQVETVNPQNAIFHFAKSNGDFLTRTINAYFKNSTSWRDLRIPDEIFKTNNQDLKKEFMRGIADVTGHIRHSNSAYGKEYNHRVYIEIMDNWMLAVDICNLLKDLNIPVHNVRWGHPNLVDTQSIEYKKGNRNYKEHQIKIFADEFEKIGFNIEHKNLLLERYSAMNRRNWKSRKPIEVAHHKFYWETRKSVKTKPPHPDEHNEKIHPEIRGKHFDSWKTMSKELGYYE